MGNSKSFERVCTNRYNVDYCICKQVGPDLCTNKPGIIHICTCVEYGPKKCMNRKENRIGMCKCVCDIHTPEKCLSGAPVKYHSINNVDHKCTCRKFGPSRCAVNKCGCCMLNSTHECVCDILPSNQCKARKGDHKCKCHLGYRLPGICLANHDDCRKQLSQNEISMQTWSRNDFLSSPSTFYQKGKVVGINDRDPVHLGIPRNPFSSISSRSVSLREEKYI